MAETITPPVEDIQQMNRKLIDQIADSEQGEVKQASTAGTNMIRRRIREEGFTRRIIPPVDVTNDDLDRVLTHDKPVIIEDMEPLSKGAKSIPFSDTADTEFYYGNKFACVFNTITTPEFTKDINELRTYRMDLRQVITDNSLKDIQTEEDGKFIAGVDTICGPASTGSAPGTGAAGVQQNFEIVPVAGASASLWNRPDYVKVLSILENNNLNSRFKESLTIYTDGKRELLEAVRKSSQRPAAAENVRREISEMQKRTRKQRQNVRQSPSKGIGI